MMGQGMYGDAMYGGMPYYDQDPYGDEDYDEEIDGLQDSSNSDDDEDEEEENGPLAGAPDGNVEINIEITERKNDIILIPDATDKDTLHHDTVHAKADNDMESTDLNFSEGIKEADEHAYQIE